MTARSRTALLTLGRLPKALDIARALHGAGWRVVVAEPFRWHLCRASRAVSRSYRVCAPNTDRQRYLDDLLAIIIAENVELIVPVSEEAIHAVLLEPRLPSHTRLFAAPADLVRALHDKQAFVARAQGLHLPVPETALLGSDAARELARTGDVVIKPVFSCSGTDVRYLTAGRTLPAEQPPHPVLVQRRLTGQHRCSQSIAWQGRVVATLTYRATLTSGTVAGAFERIEASDIDAWTERFVSATGYSGFIAFDFIDDAAGVAHAIECNPRVTSGVHFFEPADLARAIDTPGQTDVVAFRRERRLQQFYTCLTETQAGVFDRATRRANMAALFGSRDVTWQWRDPLPFVLMTPLSWDILSKAIFRRMSLGEAATADIARLAPETMPGVSIDAPASAVSAPAATASAPPAPYT